MLNPLLVPALLVALTLPVCSKKKVEQAKAPEPTEPVAVATPEPQPTPEPEPPFQLDQSSQVVVLGYHDFKETPKAYTDITPKMFEEQMQALKDNGITVIPMADFLAWKRGEKNIPQKSALITLDDGYKSAYDTAWPILKKFGYPFTIYPYIGYIHGEKIAGHTKLYWGGGSITWQQLEEMRDAGVDIGSHTLSHPTLTSKKGKSEAAYEQSVWAEIHDSKARLEEKLGIKVLTIAVPYGIVNDYVRQMAEKAGYEAVLTVNGQKVTFGTPNNNLGRYLHDQKNKGLFTAALSFSASGPSSYGAPAARIAPANFETQPKNGETISNSKPLIRVNVAGVGPIDPNSVQMRISGVGLVDAIYDADAQTISYQVTQKLRDKCSVILSATSKGKKVATNWSFTVDENAGPKSDPPAAQPAPEATGAAR